MSVSDRLTAQVDAINRQLAQTGPESRVAAAARESDQTLALRSGDEVHCPHCARWHRLKYSPLSGDGRNPLCFCCGIQTYHVGKPGETSPYPLRRLGD